MPALRIGLVLAALCALAVGGPPASAAVTASARVERTPRPAPPVRTPAPAPSPAPAPISAPILGAAVTTGGLTLDPRYAQTLLSAYGSITSEWEMKLDSLEPAQGRFDFSKGDLLAAFASSHGLKLRGHTLLWHQQLPAWITNGAWTRATLEPVLRTYVQTVVAHFRGKVDSWDVVNEPIADDGSLRQNLWLQVIGPDYIPLALTWAHQADPDAKLFVNDYNVERPGPKTDALYALASQLRASGVPLDGIGFQSHFTTTWYPTRADMTATLQRFAALGLRVELTELDVATQDGSAAQLSKQADIYRDAASACWAVPACGRITVWGIDDGATWLGVSKHPLPFDENYQPKPAYAALRSVLSQTSR